jgi:Fic family protein
MNSIPAMSTSPTLPQLIDRYRSTFTDSNIYGLNEFVRLTYHSMALEGSSLTLAQTRQLIHNDQPVAENRLTDHYQSLDHYQALKQILTMASQRQPINRIVLQEIAATLMRQTGGAVYSLLSQFDTRQGALRIDNVLVGKRPVVEAHKLPVAIDDLLKGINTRISQLKTHRQLYDFAFEAHFQLLTLHPFGAGNGPMARLLMNYIEHYHQLPLSLVYSDQRQAYQDVLEASWQQKTTVPMVHFMHSQLGRVLEDGISQPPLDPYKA